MQRYLKNAAVVVLGAAIALPASGAGIQHNPRLNAAQAYLYNGAYMAEPPTSVHTVPVLELGAGWDLGIGCGTMDPKITMSNMLNGITDGFRDAMDNIISAATAAVAGLPALALQRADPDLYNMLTMGMQQAKLDFQWAETSCEQMANVMMGTEEFPWENYKLNPQYNEWSNAINASGGDSVIAKKEATNQDDGNTGVDWACGVKKGGAGQLPIETTKDIVIVGYNILFDRANSCDTSSISAPVGGNTPLYRYWNSPILAANWVKDVVGEREIRTCDGCRKVRGTPGKGLSYKFQKARNSVLNDITDLVSGATSVTWQTLNRVSAPPGVEISKPVIDLIRTQSLDAQPGLIKKLASDVAYARMFEQARLATQMLKSGMGEPNISSKYDAIETAEKAIESLELEMVQLDREVKTRDFIVSETINRLLGGQEKQTQSTRESRPVTPSSMSPMGQPQ